MSVIVVILPFVDSCMTADTDKFAASWIVAFQKSDKSLVDPIWLPRLVVVFARRGAGLFT